MRFRKWQVIEIDWVDSISRDRWAFEDDVELQDNDMYHKTIGYFFRETKESINVVQSKTNNGRKESSVLAVMTIPKVAIKKIKKYE